MEPFAEKEERELSNYGATELEEYSSNREEDDADHLQGAREGQTEMRVVENRC